MTDREIMQQALDALEMHVLGFDGVRKMELAIEALETALAQPEQAPFGYFYEINGTYTDFSNELPPDDGYDKGTLVPVFTAPAKRGAGGAQPEQAVVSFPSFMRKRIEQAMEDAIHPKGMSVHDGKAKVLVSDLHRMLLVIDSAPTKRQWVGLTDDEINKIANSPQPIDETSNGYVLPFAHAIQSRLREKNA